MKVYVDELPSCCEDCVCHNGVNGRCKLLHRTTFDIPPKDCPLQSLADHEKQVKKEVCEQVKTELLDFSHEYWRVFKQNGKQYMTDDDIEEKLDIILDKIQGEK